MQIIKGRCISTVYFNLSKEMFPAEVALKLSRFKNNFSHQFFGAWWKENVSFINFDVSPNSFNTWVTIENLQHIFQSIYITTIAFL